MTGLIDLLGAYLNLSDCKAPWLEMTMQKSNRKLLLHLSNTFGLKTYLPTRLVQA